MQVLSIEEIDQVSGGDLGQNIGRGALAGGFAGLAVTGTPQGFLVGAAFGAVGGGIYSYFGGGGGGGSLLKYLY